MKKHSRNVGLVLLLCLGMAGCAASEPRPESSKKIADEQKKPETVLVEDNKGDVEITAGEDVLASVLAANGKDSPKPGSSWKKGHVSPRQFDSKHIKKKANGFEIQFPSGAPIPTPTVYKNKLLVSGGFRSKQFFCADAKTGDIEWAVDLDDDGPSTAVAEDDVVVFNTESCTIFALNVNTGKQLWSWWLGDPLMSTPTIANGMVFTSYPAGGGGHMQQVQHSNSLHHQNQVQQNPAPLVQSPPENNDKSDAVSPMPSTHVLAAFDLKTGEVLWQKWIDSDVMSAPVAVDNELYVATFSGTVYKVEQKSGKIISARRDRATSAPVIASNEVFYTQRAEEEGSDKPVEAIAVQGRASGKKHKVYARKSARYLDAEVQSKSEYKAQSSSNDAANGFAGGAPAAANAGAAMGNIGQSNVSSLQAFQGSRIYYRDGKNYNTMGDEIMCTDSKSGKTLWKKKLIGNIDKAGGSIGTSPAAAGNDLFVATLDGEVLQLSTKSGEAKKVYKIGSPVRAQPAIVDGRIYVGTQDGKVVCVNTGNKKLTGWNTWGKDARHSGTSK